MTGRCQTPGGKSWAATLADLFKAGSWMQYAACRLEDAALFTAEHRPNQAVLDSLAQICARCPVTADCARLALTEALSGFYAGVWIEHGHPASGRRVLRRQSAADHGTEAGAQQHRRRGEKPCFSCQLASARAVAERRHRKARSHG